MWKDSRTSGRLIRCARAVEPRFPCKPSQWCDLNIIRENAREVVSLTEFIRTLNKARVIVALHNLAIYRGM